MLALLGCSSSSDAKINASNTLSSLVKSRRQNKMDEEADRCVQKTLGPSGSGIAYEQPDRSKSWNREMLKVTTAETKNNVHVIAYSRLKRTMADTAILQSMGLGTDVTDPNVPPPSDAQLILAYYNKMIAKQRWAKAHNALGALRALKIAGGGSMDNLLASPGPGTPSSTPFSPGTPPGSPAMPAARMSVTLAKSDKVTASIMNQKMAKLPKSEDVAELLRRLNGKFAFVVLDLTKGYALASRSADGESNLFSAVDPKDGSIIFSTEEGREPQHCSARNMPAGSYFLGRYRESTELDFKAFVKEPAAAA